MLAGAPASKFWGVFWGVGMTEFDGHLGMYSNHGVVVHAHQHEALEFNLVLGGSGTYVIGEQRYPIGPQTLIWLYPSQRHILLDQSPDLRMWIAHFKPSLVKAYTHADTETPLAQAEPVGVFCKRISADATERLGKIYLKVVDGIHKPQLFNAGLGWALLATWEEFLGGNEVLAWTDLHPAVETASRILREEPELELLESLATRCHVSFGWLSRTFKKQVGVALYEYRNQQRLDKFFRLYLKGRRSNLTEAALNAGFGSYPQFYRVFKATLGCPPGQFRLHSSGDPL